MSRKRIRRLSKADVMRRATRLEGVVKNRGIKPKKSQNKNSDAFCRIRQGGSPHALCARAPLAHTISS